eukprot:gene3559-6294_t
MSNKLRMRSLLYIPGNSSKMLAKTLNMKIYPDVFVPDLEDSVPFEYKKDALKQVSKFIEEDWKNFKLKNKKIKSLILPRLNNDLNLLPEELQKICSPSIDGINLGKVSNIKEFNEIIKLIEETENKKGLQKNSIKIIPSIETAEGLTNIAEICSSHKERTIGLCFGADDFANDMGITRNTSSYEENLEFARNQISIYARAHNLVSIDTPNVNFKNLDSLIEESTRVKSIGFKGKFAIHPNQIESLNDIFGISKQEYERAKEIVDIPQ